MKKQRLLILSILFVLFSCEGNKNSELKTISDNIQSEPLILNQVDSAHNFSKEEFIDSQFEYSDSIGNSLLVQNSFPKGGQKYTDPKGNRYVYAVFWTRISNQTSQNIRINLKFTTAAQVLSSSPEIRFNLILAPVSMSEDKIHQMNYGLSNIDFILDNTLGQFPEFDQKIQPNESEMFYVIVLTSQGIDGTIRSSLQLENQDLIYHINQTEIKVGKAFLGNP